MSEREGNALDRFGPRPAQFAVIHVCGNIPVATSKSKPNLFESGALNTRTGARFVAPRRGHILHKCRCRAGHSPGGLWHFVPKTGARNSQSCTDLPGFTSFSLLFSTFRGLAKRVRSRIARF